MIIDVNIYLIKIRGTKLNGHPNIELMKKPNFLLVGASKSGSTTLYHLLKQHPEIFLPSFKEPLYFISEIVKNISEKDIGYKNERNKDKFIHSKSKYLALFEPVKNEKAIGEASATYLYYYKNSIPLIKKELNDPKIIIILRNPIGKIFSQYKHLQKLHGENRSFEKALELEEERIDQNFTAMYHYKAQGLYYDQVKAFKDNFSDVLVVLTNELKNNPLLLVKKCYTFLEVDETFEPEILDFNVSTKRIKNRSLHKALYNKRAHELKMFFRRIFGSSFYDNYTKKYKKMNSEKIGFKIKENTKNELNKFFKKDIENLEKLLSKDLSDWKS